MTYSLKRIQYCVRVIFIFCVTYTTFGQEKIFTIPDSLADKSYEYLLETSRKNYTDTILSLIYLQTYYAKATIENNKVEKSAVLTYISYYAKKKTHAIDLAEKSLNEIKGIDNERSILIYNHIGSIYHNYFEYDAALKHYLKALNLSEKLNAENYKHFLYNNIANLKADIGKHDQALLLYKKCLAHENTKKHKDSLGNIETIINLAMSMRENKKHDSASYYYNYIIDVAYKKNSYYGDMLTLNEGFNLFYKKEYSAAEKLINNGIAQMVFNTDTQQSYILSQLYLGKIYDAEYKDEEKTKAYFTKTDSLLSLAKAVIPKTEDAYKFLISYYEKKGNIKEQLNAVNKLLQLKTVIASRNIKTANTLHSEFDMPELLKSKETLIHKLEQKTTTLNTRAFYLITFILILLLLFIIQYNRHKRDKKRFNSLLKKIDVEGKESISQKSSIIPQKLNIEESVIASILEKLDHFETNNEFLKVNINVSSLAKICNTNTKYLSRIINTHKKKPFINYINDLRIDYILKELKKNPILQRYTIKSISGEAGFNNAESFATAFKKRTGLKPSYFIKNLKSSSDN